MKSLLSLLFFLLCTLALQAQQTGTIIGTIVDDEGEPVIGAVVRLLPAGSGGGVTKAPNGEFCIAGIKPGEYTAEISGIGYSKVSRRISVAENNVVDVGTVQVVRQVNLCRSHCGLRVAYRFMMTYDRIGTTRIITREDLW